MPRRSETSPGLKVRVSHEADRLSKAHAAAAFEHLVPTLERRARPPCAAGDAPRADPVRRSTKPMRAV
jgi:hypothetical protein